MANNDNVLQDHNVFLPLSPQDFQVLMVVFDRPLHGYGIVKASSGDSTKPVLDLGSLYRIISRLIKKVYRIISRLIKKGLIEAVSVEQPDSKRQRRYYKATDLGRRVARAEAVRLRDLLESEHAELLWEKP
jgi:DNA-binding PadR family transcriptional regulator